MPKGVSIHHDVEAMILLVIKERRIALPITRLAWYAHWFGLPVSAEGVAAIARHMVKDGRLLKVMDGRRVYYKIRRK
jgi:hypothetical protein